MKENAVIISLFLVFTLIIFVGIEKIENNILNVVSLVSEKQSFTVVLDAGHGGEDGGAVAFDNTNEKDINLEVTKCIADYFDLFGINYVLIRDGDYSVGDTSLETIRKRKSSDIHKRFDIVNSTENSLLLSIHQNFFQIEKYSGLQVFYSGNDEISQKIAHSIQKKTASLLQPENNRKIKQADKSLYLLFNATRPSVMVECGFLSNFNELEQLKTVQYRSALSYTITSAINDYLIGNQV